MGRLGETKMLILELLLEVYWGGIAIVGVVGVWLYLRNKKSKKGFQGGTNPGTVESLALNKRTLPFLRQRLQA